MLYVPPTIHLLIKGRPPPTPIDSGSHRTRVLARRDALVNSHLHLVPPIARRVHSCVPPSFDLDDLIAVGNLKLVHLATRYRPRQHAGCPFAAFARPGIEGAIRDSVRRKNWRENTHEAIPEHIEVPFVDPFDIDVEEDQLLGRLVVAFAGLSQRRRELLASYYNPSTKRRITPANRILVKRWREDAIRELRRLLGAA